MQIDGHPATGRVDPELDSHAPHQGLDGIGQLGITVIHKLLVPLGILLPPQPLSFQLLLELASRRFLEEPHDQGDHGDDDPGPEEPSTGKLF